MTNRVSTHNQQYKNGPSEVCILPSDCLQTISFCVTTWLNLVKSFQINSIWIYMSFSISNCYSIHNHRKLLLLHIIAAAAFCPDWFPCHAMQNKKKYCSNVSQSIIIIITNAVSKNWIKKRVSLDTMGSDIELKSIQQHTGHVEWEFNISNLGYYGIHNNACQCHITLLNCHLSIAFISNPFYAIERI